MSHQTQHEGSGQPAGSMQNCIETCNDCRDSCLASVSHCLELGGKHAEAGHIGLLLDCADICGTSAAFMLRGSTHHKKVCGTCAEICQACAESCRSMGGADEMMASCAEVCERCAESCEKMAGHAA